MRYSSSVQATEKIVGTHPLLKAKLTLIQTYGTKHLFSSQVKIHFLGEEGWQGRAVGPLRSWSHYTHGQKVKMKEGMHAACCSAPFIQLAQSTILVGNGIPIVGGSSYLIYAIKKTPPKHAQRPFSQPLLHSVKLTIKTITTDLRIDGISSLLNIW